MDDDKAAPEGPAASEDPWDDPAVQERLRFIHLRSLVRKSPRSEVWETATQGSQHDPTTYRLAGTVAVIAIVLGSLLTFLMN